MWSGKNVAAWARLCWPFLQTKKEQKNGGGKFPLLLGGSPSKSNYVKDARMNCAYCTTSLERQGNDQNIHHMEKFPKVVINTW